MRESSPPFGSRVDTVAPRARFVAWLKEFINQSLPSFLLLKHSAFTRPTSERSAVCICPAKRMLSYNSREDSLQTGMMWAFSQRRSPESNIPANHSERVILKTFMPAARIAVISLFRCSDPNTYISDNKRLIGKTTGTKVGDNSP